MSTMLEETMGEISNKLIIGEITHCLACGKEIPKGTFPHLCPRCITSIRETGHLPLDVEQQLLKTGEEEI